MKPNSLRLTLLGAIAALALAPAAFAQRRPYIGYTYPAGGQQATTFQVKLGGQDLDDVNALLVTGAGVTARIISYQRKLNPQEIQLLNEQLRVLKRASPETEAPPAPKTALDEAAMMTALATELSAAKAEKTAATHSLIAKIEQRTREWVQVPACASIASIVIAEVTIAPDAAAGPRELRLATPRGVSNPLVFHVGALREYTRKPMLTASIQILGKEALALRRRPPGENDERVELPCTVNGQVSSGEVTRYRFTATKGQRLVLAVQARQLIPFVADAVPGWFQPVLMITDAQGREMAFADDYRFQPDPVLLFQVPADGEYTFAIHDSIYRGREDFIYRISVGELPFVTSVFPLGAPANAMMPPNAEGWNIADATLALQPDPLKSDVTWLSVNRTGFTSNRVPFALDSLPETTERGSNDTLATAEPVTLPVIVNGRIERPDDRDVFQFAGKAGETIVADVHARRLDSPLDSMLRLTDAAGKVIAFNDDREDPAAGVNTHHADSYLTATLPADATYFITLNDTARHGGTEYGYRLRLSAPQPDFELRIVPSSVSLPVNSSASLTVYAVRRDGFTGPIKLALKSPSPSLSAAPVTLPGNQSVARFTIRSGPRPTAEPLRISVLGGATIDAHERVHEAVAAEDRMQAFLWRHLVPASDLRVMVFDPRRPPPPKRIPPSRPAPMINAAEKAAVVSSAAGGTNVVPDRNAAMVASVAGGANASPIAKVGSNSNTGSGTNVVSGANVSGTSVVPPAGASPNVNAAPAANLASSANAAPGGTGAAGTVSTPPVTPPKPKFTKQQIVGRLRQLKLLYEEGLLTDSFYLDRVAECETAQ